jgi:hypothetical protein
MTFRTLAPALPLLALCLVLQPGAAGDNKNVWKKFLPKETFEELVKREAKLAASFIGIEDFEKAQRGKVAALMIVGYTLSAKDGDGKQMQAIRNAALRLAELIGEKGKEAEAKMLAASLAELKGDPDAKHQGMNFKQYMNNDYHLMVPYMTRAKGGDGLHPDLQFSSRLKGTQEFIENLFAYASRKPLTEKYVKQGAKELELVGYRTAISGELMAAYQPATKSKKRDPVVWEATTKDMIAGALDLAEASKKQDAEAIQKASARVLDSCVRCHKVFQ